VTNSQFCFFVIENFVTGAAYQILSVAMVSRCLFFRKTLYVMTKLITAIQFPAFFQLNDFS